jgi:ankyrin repeat protein
MRSSSGLFFSFFLSVTSLSAQKVDFSRDVQPIFKANCYGCHGPAQQMNSFRLDRRSDAMRGGTLAQIGPGNAAGSRMYLRLTGNQYGLQMPPTGPLSSEQIDVIKRWIDQGAEWPDDLSGEVPPAPPDPGAGRIMSALRNGDTAAFRKTLTADAKSINRKGPTGATPLMYAVLYGDDTAVRLLLDKGADPNIRNDAGASALMWAAGDLAKARMLVEKGADVNARSDGGRTALLIAAGNPRGAEVVKLLLDRHADPNVKAPGLFTEVTPLSEAAYNEPVLRMLIDHGADVRKAGFFPLFVSVVTHCTACSDILFKSAGPDVVNPAMLFLAPPLSDATQVKLLLEHGADPNAKSPAGDTILMLTCSSDHLPVDSVKALLERKADVNARNPAGLTALDFARKRGNTPIVDLLLKAGAKPGSGAAAPAAKPNPAESARAAVLRSLPLLQKTDSKFLQQAGCVSCHNNTLAALTLTSAHKDGLPVNMPARGEQLKKIATYLDTWRERALQGVGIPGDQDTVSSILVGMAVQGHAPDPATDAMAFYLRSKQLPNGMWPILAHRPPLESSLFQVTAFSLRALQTYAPKARKAEFEQTIQMGRKWLSSAEPHTVDDRAFQLIGLGWVGADRSTIQKFAAALIKEQRPDGGWAQLDSLDSDAYATGQALVGLRDSGAIASTDPAYQRGVKFLLKTQMEDGSWHVASRAIPIQPYFESGFPHGHDQWISSTATSWAAMALLR